MNLGPRRLDIGLPRPDLVPASPLWPVAGATMASGGEGEEGAREGVGARFERRKDGVGGRARVLPW